MIRINIWHLISDDDEKFEADSDIEDGDDDDGMPDSRAWGSKRRDYHSTDFVDQDYSSYSQREQELADEEETEALAIQQRLAKQLEESDFSLDVFTSAEPKKTDAKAKKSTEIYLQKDLSELSQRQKEQLFKKESPEFESLVQDFRLRLKESIDLLEPISKYLKTNGVESHPLVDFISNQNQLILNYCTNVSFYLVLKAKRVPVQNHPIVKRLVQIRQLLLQIDEKYTAIVKPQLEQLLQAINEGKEFKIDELPAEKKEKKKLRFVQSIENGDGSSESDEEAGANDEDMEFKKKLEQLDSDSEEEDEQQDDEMGEEDERRQITYQIAKNKGLTPYRQKELRNPRVKHRNKFRKALIRRKGAHRTVRKEIQRYDGEKFGIKAGVKKGIKLK